MNILFFIIPGSIFLGSLFLLFFIKAFKDGQFDDLETPATKILINDYNKGDKND